MKPLFCQRVTVFKPASCEPQSTVWPAREIADQVAADPTACTSIGLVISICYILKPDCSPVTSRRGGQRTQQSRTLSAVLFNPQADRPR